MKARWSALFWSALSALIGITWLAKRFGMSSFAFLHVQFLGMVVAAAIAFVAMIKAYEQKWPAAIVLVCAGPLAILAFRMLPDLAEIAEYLELPGVLIVVGTLTTIVLAVLILARPVPIRREDPIARATVVDD